MSALKSVALSVVVGLIAWATLCSGDVLVTTSGTEYEGQVTQDGDTYILVKANGSRITFPKSVIAEVRQTPTTAPVAPDAPATPVVAPATPAVVEPKAPPTTSPSASAAGNLASMVKLSCECAQDAMPSGGSGSALKMTLLINAQGSNAMKYVEVDSATEGASLIVYDAVPAFDTPSASYKYEVKFATPIPVVTSATKKVLWPQAISRALAGLRLRVIIGDKMYRVTPQAVATGLTERDGGVEAALRPEAVARNMTREQLLADVKARLAMLKKEQTDKQASVTRMDKAATDAATRTCPECGGTLEAKPRTGPPPATRHWAAAPCRATPACPWAGTASRRSFRTARVALIFTGT